MYQTSNNGSGIGGAGVRYFDANATTFMPDLVIKSMIKWANKGNPSSHYASAKECDTFINLVKQTVLRDNGFTNHVAVFTSGSSESNTHIITSSVRSFINKTNYLPHVLISELEHKSISMCCEHLQDDGLCTFTKVPVCTEPGPMYGTILENALEAAIQPNTCLISIMSANNETGVMNDIPALAAVAHRHKIPFHTDCTQTFGKYGVYSGVDACSISFHKMHGPPGVGLLVVRKNFMEGYGLRALICGTQNDGMRGGTENMPGIGAAYAAYKFTRLKRDEKNRHLESMKEVLKDMLKARFECFYVDEFGEQKKGGTVKIFWISNRDPSKMLPNTLLFSIYKNEICNVKVKEELEKYGVIVSVGSACNTKSKLASDVLRAMGVPDDLKKGVLRISMDDDVTRQDLLVLVNSLADILASGIGLSTVDANG